MSGALIAAGCLAVGGGWRAILVVADVRRIRQLQPGGRAYRPEFGWTDMDLLRLRQRWSWVGLVSATGLLGTFVAPASSAVLWPAAGAAITVWVVREAGLEYGRYVSVCLGTLAVGVGLASVSTAAAGLLASIAASQMYLVAAIRKLRSRDFMSGRVVLDNVAYAVCQAAAGNRDFIRTVTPGRLADLLERGTLLRGARLAAVATAAAELAVGLGAIGVFPVAVTFGLAIPLHGGFTLLSPRRLLSFTAAALGLLALASVNPVLLSR